MKRMLKFFIIFIFILLQFSPIYAVSNIRSIKSISQQNNQLLFGKSQINIAKNKLFYSNDNFMVYVDKRHKMTNIKFLKDTSVESISIVKPETFFSYDDSIELIGGTVEYAGDLSLYGSEGTWEVLYSNKYKKYEVVVFLNDYLNWEYISNVWQHTGDGLKIGNVEINRINLTKSEAMPLYRQAPIDYLFGMDDDIYYKNLPLFIATWCDNPETLLIFVHND